MDGMMLAARARPKSRVVNMVVEGRVAEVEGSEVPRSRYICREGTVTSFSSRYVGQRRRSALWKWALCY